MSPSRSAARRFLEEARAEVDSFLRERMEAFAGASSAPKGGRLAVAMRYALLGPEDAAGGGAGKRLRPAVCLAVAEGLGGFLGLAAARRRALPAAAAIEMIHAYSLVHDDLPSMDDDRLRRGIAATHVAFGPATAARAGVALQLEAFRTLAAEAEGGPPPPVRAALVRLIAAASGQAGLVGGQWLDLERAGQSLAPAEETRIHERKTAALFRAAAGAGALAVEASAAAVAGAERYGVVLGLGFQILDDLDDEAGGTAREVAPARARLDVLAAEADELARQIDPRGDASPVVLMVKAALARVSS